MIKLEALRAKHGDCLILQWGDEGELYTALIDGGPSGVYKDFLRPRILELAAAEDNAVILDLLMLSHIDDDHINGLLDLAKEIKDRRCDVNSDQEFPKIRVRHFWHNSLEELLDYEFPSSGTLVSTASAEVKQVPDIETATVSQYEKHFDSMVLASVPQGQQLHEYARVNGWPINAEFHDPPLVVCRKGAESKVVKGLNLTVIAPAIAEIEKLRKVWKEKRKEDVTAAYRDRSPYNLSSIVVLAEYGGREVLLTGDARGDHILNGLETCGLLDKNGCIHVDVLKLSHHGSQNNVEKNFFEKVTADFYVVSGDRVKFPNPSEAAMQWLSDARGDDSYKIYCTYEIDGMRKLFGDKLITPAKDKDSVCVSLGD
jgi:beta-lactamase superfamily II metal-dependent hydrolase